MILKMKDTTLYIAIGFLVLIGIFSYITYSKNKKISDANKAAAKLAADNKRLQDNTTITAKDLADLISKQMDKQKTIQISY